MILLTRRKTSSDTSEATLMFDRKLDFQSDVNTRAFHLIDTHDVFLVVEGMMFEGKVEDGQMIWNGKTLSEYQQKD